MIKENILKECSGKIRWSLIFYFCFAIVWSQNKDVLMVVNEDSITSDEFLRVYNKNLDLVKDASQKELDNYLELFTEYQLKLNEARRLKLDEDQSYVREFNNYKQQLTQSYLVENEVTQELVEEAYDRMRWDVKAVHVLVRLDENEQDTLVAYNQALSYRDRLAKDGFSNLKKDIHNGKTIIAEDLGYFSAFKMVYNFESAVYNTEVGEISMPFRTKFGYHIVKVIDKRPTRGTMTAAHIMVANEQQDSTINPEKRIQMLYRKLENGESFKSLAKQFSDDKGSAKKGGELRAFKSGDLSSTEFEDAAYELQNDGDYSRPFQTKFGWHIVKRLKVEPLASFEELETNLKSKVKRDSRSKVINKAMVDELKLRYDVYENPKARPYFISVLDDRFFERKWTLAEGYRATDTLFSINERVYTFGEYGSFLLGQQRNYSNRKTPFGVIYDNSYDYFFEISILKYREENLVNENPEFAAVLKEYRDGLLLFELMEQEVWNKAAEDSIGLRSYFEKHSSDYQWNQRIDMVMASSTNKKDLKRIDKKLMRKEMLEELKERISNEDSDVIITSGVFNTKADILPEDLKLEKNKTALYQHNESFHLINVLDVMPQGPQSFEEARGKVINDYQNYIETKWMEGLKERFPVWIDQKVLNELKSK